MSGQELLLKPNVQELSARETAWVQEAQMKYSQDVWMQTKQAGFDPSVHPAFRGFYISRQEQAAYPVFATDNGIFAVDHDNARQGVTQWRVNEVDIYSLE